MKKIPSKVINSIRIKAYKLLLPVLLLVCLLGCNTYQKQVKQFHLFAYNNPEELAKDCARLWPCKDMVTKSDTVHVVDTIAGPIILKDTTVIDGTKTITKTQVKYVHDKTVIHDTTRVLDQAKQAVLSGQIEALKHDLAVSDTRLSQANETSYNWRKWCLIAWGGIGVLGLIKLGQLYLKFKGI